MADKEFTIGAETYRASALNAFEQFHCLRRLGTVFGALAQAMQGVGKAGQDAPALAGMEPIMTAMSSIPDADANFVLETCLKHVQRKQGSGWAPIWSSGAAGVLLFGDIDMAAMLRIVWSVLEGDLASFFGALASDATGPAASPKST